MKRLCLTVAFTTLLANGTLAQTRPVTLGMSCARANALVTRQGAIVLGTGPYTYDRYVSSQAFCLSTEFARPAWVPTADTPQCFIGYTCVSAPPSVGWLSLHNRKDLLN